MNGTTEPMLTHWQSRQASMFYYFTSVEYLQTMHRMVGDLINGVVDPLLDTARRQGRDALLQDARWGARRTSENWANHAWPVLNDLHISFAETLTDRQNNRYTRPSVDEFLHGIGEFSLEWTTREEEDIFTEAIQRISTMGGWLDDTLANEEISRWDDFDISYHFPLFSSVCPRIGRFKVRLDVMAETGTVPPVTGVYIAWEDPNATLQFAFAEHGGRELRMANTFNDIGLAALAYAGRDALWTNNQKMLEFVTLPQYKAIFHDQIFLQGLSQPTLARAALSGAAITTKPVKWYLVEAVDVEWTGDGGH